MERIAHYLKPINGQSAPSQIVAVACDAIPAATVAGGATDVTKLGCWYARSWRRERGEVCRVNESYGLDSDSFWAWLESRSRKNGLIWIIGYCMARQLTLLGAWDRLDDCKLRLVSLPGDTSASSDGKSNGDWRGFVVLGDPPTILVCRPAAGHCTYKMIDSRNYSDSTIGDLAESIGWRVHRPQPYSGTLARRLVKIRRDCRVVAEWFNRWVDRCKTMRLGPIQPTVGSQALTGFRSGYMRHDILVHANDDALRLERESYYGGRNECYYLGTVRADLAGEQVSTWEQGPVYHFDFNSLYPSVMIGNGFPAKLKFIVKRLAVDELEGLLKDQCAIARVKLRTEDHTYPVRLRFGPLPQDSRLLFIRGEFTTVLAGPELCRALAHRHVQEVYDTAVYSRDNIFDGYVDGLYSYRIQCKRRRPPDKVGDRTAKLLMNCLPGKLGQKRYEWEAVTGIMPHGPYATWPVYDEDKDTVQWYRSTGWLVEKRVEVGEGHESCPAISAYVNSYARERLLKAMLCAGPKEVYYVDTDSLFVSAWGAMQLRGDNWVDPDRLGLLKEVGCYRLVEFRGLKHYVADGVVTLSGFPRDSQPVSINQYYVSREQSVREVIAGGKRSEIRTLGTLARIKTKYDRGVVHGDGTVTPFWFEDGVLCDRRVKV